MGISYVDGLRLRRSLVAACEQAQGMRQELNRINVFPVPDGDTGTNLALTAQSIVEALGASSQMAVGSVALEAAEASVMGARGNGGMMLSHFLLGFPMRSWVLCFLLPFFSHLPDILSRETGAAKFVA